jgi:hypothetical protein
LNRRTRHELAAAGRSNRSPLMLKASSDISLVSFPVGGLSASLGTGNESAQMDAGDVDFLALLD